MTGPRGFDGAKKVDGLKRHVLIDSADVLVAAIVTPADAQDRAAFPTLLDKARRVAPTISHAQLPDDWWPYGRARLVPYGSVDHCSDVSCSRWFASKIAVPACPRGGA